MKCKVCVKVKELRSGSCFGCSGKVSGREVEEGHQLWVTLEPWVNWVVDKKGEVIK